MCRHSVACTGPAGTYPHIGQNQNLWIEFPPQFPKDVKRGGFRTWHDVIGKVRSNPALYIYLPHVLMHEFGHTAGLGHLLWLSLGLMAGYDDSNDRKAKIQLWDRPGPHDLKGMEYLYDGHNPH